MDTGIRRKPAPMQDGGFPRQQGDASGADLNGLKQVLAYHERTKHSLELYAKGPETLDWTSQPDPFRHFEGAAKIALPLSANRLATPYFALHQPGAVPAQPLSQESIGLLLELSLGLSAWKEYGPDRWALRCTPSSGNLHPTEGYLIGHGIPGLPNGVYHYLSRDHVLEQRCCGAENRPDAPARLWIGLSSIHWREAWKYGERAFRYCQLDIGHAIGSLRYAAAALGWRLRLLEGVSWQQIAHQLGLDRSEDFAGAELEEAELLLEVIVDAGADGAISDSWEPVEASSQKRTWKGLANRLDPHPMYHWPVIDEVAQATRMPPVRAQPFAVKVHPPRACLSAEPAATIIRQRRSAQRFDGRHELSRHDFYRLLDALLPRPTPPWDVWGFSPRLHPVFFVHRVEGLAPGLYILLRRTAAGDSLRAAMHNTFKWSKPSDCPDHLPFFQLAAAGCGQLAKMIHCHQAIASDSMFALGMLAEYEATLALSPWRYRQLHWEAGLIGHTLYLEAETQGLRGTGIGCYFDESFHQLLGLTGCAFQSLYHFTVGYPVTDTRILTLPPYPASGGQDSQ